MAIQDSLGSMLVGIHWGKRRPVKRVFCLPPFFVEIHLPLVWFCDFRKTFCPFRGR